MPMLSNSVVGSLRRRKGHPESARLKMQDESLTPTALHPIVYEKRKSLIFRQRNFQSAENCGTAWAMLLRQRSVRDCTKNGPFADGPPLHPAAPREWRFRPNLTMRILAFLAAGETLPATAYPFRRFRRNRTSPTWRFPIGNSPKRN